MRKLRALLLRLAGAFQQDESEFSDELQTHLELRIDDLILGGMNPAEARRTALMESGGLEIAKDEYRERRGLRRVGCLLHDARYALRTLGRSPGFTLTATMTLALGIGANTAIFSVVNAALLQQLPFLEPGRLVMVWEKTPSGLPNVVNPMNFLDWQARNHSFDRFAAFIQTGASLTGGGEPEQVDNLYVSDGFLETLGVTPQIGRWFTADDQRAASEDVVVLSNELWKRRFGSDTGVLGRSIQVDHRARRVIGVMGAGFRFPQTKAQIWQPLGLERATANTKGRYLWTVARLRSGASAEAAQADMNVLSSQLQRERPELNSKWGITVVSLREQVNGDIRTPLLVLLAAVGLVLLIACANVANLMLMRSSGRAREFAVRSALGASAGRIASQLLVESTIIGLLSGAGGLLLGVWATRILTAALPDTAAYSSLRTVHIDLAVLLFAAVISLLTAILFGLAPTVRAVHADPQQALREAGRSIAGRRGRMRDMLVIAEVALSMMLLVGAGLLIRSFVRLSLTGPGFDAPHVISMQLSERGRFRNNQELLNFNMAMLEKVRALPGVEAAGTSHFLPLGPIIPGTSFWRADTARPKAGEEPITEVLCVLPGYFAALSIPIRRGRVFTDRDRAGAPLAVVVNQTLAGEFFPGEDAIDKRLYISWGKPDDTYEIVGIVGDVHQKSLEEAARPSVYFPTLQAPTTPVYLVARTSGDPRKLTPAIRAAIQSLDREVPISDIRTMDQYVSNSVSSPRFHAILLGGFAALATLLATVGIFGVISYSVAQRTQEIGVRRALGAGAAGVMGLVLAQGMRLAVAGVALGAAGALALTRLLRSMLFEVSPTDSATFVMVAALLLAVAFLASYIPARRAVRVDPMQALRYE